MWELWDTKKKKEKESNIRKNNIIKTATIRVQTPGGAFVGTDKKNKTLYTDVVESFFGEPE